MPTQFAGPKWQRRVDAFEYALKNQQAGVAVQPFQIVYRDGNFWQLSDASDPNTVPQRGLGMAAVSGASGQTGIPVWTKAIVSNGSWSPALVSGARVFLASGLGNITMSSPTASGNMVVPLGIALTTTMLYFTPGQAVQNGA